MNKNIFILGFGLIIGYTVSYFTLNEILYSILYITGTVFLLFILYFIYMYIQFYNSESGTINVNKIEFFDTENEYIKLMKVQYSTEYFRKAITKDTVDKVNSAKEIEKHFFYTRVGNINFKKSLKEKLLLTLYIGVFRHYPGRYI